MAKPAKTGYLTLLACVLALNAGCITYARNYLPVKKVPLEFLVEPRSLRQPINLSLLGQAAPPEYVAGPRDLFAVYVQGVLPTKVDSIPILSPGVHNRSPEYFFKNSNINFPATGIPIEVKDNGTLPLPLIGDVDMRGLTIEQAAHRIRAVYIEKQIITPENDRVLLTLVKPRVTRVLVIREDVRIPEVVRATRDASVTSRRGRAEIVTLPAFQNDVLHALTATGGLPGQEAFNEVWVLRRSYSSMDRYTLAQQKITSGMAPLNLLEELRADMSATRIPLQVRTDLPIPFSNTDVILNEGDIVFIAPRDNEYFYVGGTLPGARIPLPRDRDLDVLEAIAMANGSVGGPIGGAGGGIRAVASPGAIVPPSIALIVRKLPNGQQIPIRVELKRALFDPEERLIIAPGDLIMLRFTPRELAANIGLNIINFNISGLFSFF